MEHGLILRSLERLHDECEAALRAETTETGESIINRYNLLLEKFEKEHPAIVESKGFKRMEYPSPESDEDVGDEILNTIQDIKFNSFELVDSLDISERDFKDISQRSGFSVIDINFGSDSGEPSTTVPGVDDIKNDIEELRLGSDRKNELKGLLEEYDREADSGRPDYDRIREIMNEIHKYSGDIARNLVLNATDRGLYVLKRYQAENAP
jgi:hypothetical protein